MKKHLFRKFFGLVILYIIIIFGIFAIQFRKELSIFQNFQSLTLRLTSNSSQTDETEPSLSNSFRVSGNGIIIYASESNPILLQKNDGSTIPLVLQNWEEQDENSFSLLFSNDVSLSFRAAETGFDIRSTIPNERDTLIIPYEVASAYNITDVLKNKVIVKSKDLAYLLSAGDVTTNTILLSLNTNQLAQVSAYEETQAFTFNSIIAMQNASEEAFSTVKSQARNYIVRSYEAAQADTSNEKFIAAYVAELALQGRYADAIAKVPASFVNGSNRTYFTAPYFNTLVAMNQTLVRENENILFSMQYSLERNLLDVYELDTFPTFLLQQRAEDITAILSLPASMENFSPSVQQAAGILDVYVTLAKHSPTSASLLSPILETCVTTIQSTTTLAGELLSITTDEGNINLAFSVKAGFVLKEYGTISSRSELVAGGNMLITSALQGVSTIPATTVSHMYPYLITDNPYYPHADIIGYNNDLPIWIWNIVPVKNYEQAADGTITMHFDFPVTEIYHSIIRGIDPFTDIEIYGLDYATDPRFETYNAPGYVYDEDTKTLLLRYRQRSEIEEMKLYYTPVQEEPIQAVVSETEQPVAAAAP